MDFVDIAMRSQASFERWHCFTFI